MAVRGRILSMVLWTLAFVGFHGILLLWWYAQETRPPAWDPTIHLHLAVDYRDSLTQDRPVLSHWASFYPPAYHWSLVPAFLVLSPSEATATSVHLGYLGVLTIALLVLGRRWYGTERVGWLAAVGVMACLHLLWVFRRALIDFPLTVMVTLGWASLAACEGFTKRWTTILFGVVSGWGCLMKPTYGFFVFPGASWTLFSAWRSFPHRRSLIVRHSLWAVLCLLAMTGPWYCRHFAKFVKAQTLNMVVQKALEGNPPVCSLPAWTYYAKALVPQMGGPLAALAVIAGAVSLALRRREDRWAFLWVASGYVGLTLMRNKDYRYTLPYLPALALLVSGWVWRLKGARWVGGLAGVAAMGQVVYTSFALDPPRPEDWKHRELLQTMAAWHDPREPLLLCAVLANHPMLFGQNLRWTARTLGIPMETTGVGDDPGEFAEFLVFKTGDLGPASAPLAATAQRLRNAGRSFWDIYQLLATYPLPDGSHCQLFRREPRVFRIPDLSLKALEHQLQQRLPTAFHIDPTAAHEGPLITVHAEASLEELRRGRIRRLTLAGRSVRIRKTPIADFQLEVDDVWLNLYRLWDHGELALLSVGTLRPTVHINPTDLARRLTGKVKGLEALRLSGEGSSWTIEGRYRGFPVVVQGSARLMTDMHQMVWRVDHASLAGWPLPVWLLGDYRTQRIPLTPTASFPITLHLHHIEWTHDHLRIS